MTLDTAPPAFGKRTTADEVLTGLDLTGKTMLVTGCNAGLGLETMRALAAHGAHVIGLARSDAAAAEACASVPGQTTPVACDLANAASIASAVDRVAGLDAPLDALIANAGIMMLPKLTVSDGLELQFLVNHIGHFQLVTGLVDKMRAGSGRVVMLSSTASIGLAPKAGILFDNLDGAKGYSPTGFYGQSKLANALFAKSLAARLSNGVTANSVHPGVITSTKLGRNMGPLVGVLFSIASAFTKTIPQGAATQVLVAAHPGAEGVTGQYWSDCHVAKGSRHLPDTAMAERLWAVSEEIVARRVKAI